MKILFHLSYDGKKFHGFQKQPSPYSTIQEQLEKVLRKFFPQEIHTLGSGRTDSGVHANHQTLLADLDSKLLNKITLKKLIQILNQHLPEEIRITSIEKVDSSFHPRFSAQVRCYRYQIFFLDPNQYTPYFKTEYLAYYHCITFAKQPINVAKLYKYFKPLEGSHDFTSFSSSSKEEELNCQRIIYKIDLLQKGRRLWIEIYGNGFLRSMVRSIIGNVLFSYRKGFPANHISKILAAKDRNYAKQRVPANALFLKKVFYTNPFLPNQEFLSNHSSI